MPEQIADNIYLCELPNGLTVLAEPLDHVVSTAMMISVPLGAARDTELHSGAAGIIDEWIFRGAANRNSREIAARLDFLGCHRDETVASESLSLSASQTDRALYDTMEVYADLVSNPALSDDTFTPCVELAMQELDSLEDQPAKTCSLELRKLFYPAPLGMNPYGEKNAIEKLDAASLRNHANKYLTPKGSILAVAGKFELEDLISNAEKFFGPWSGSQAEAIEITESGTKTKFIEKPTSQVQIGLACRAPLNGEKDYYPCRIAEMVLSGGMSGRLFTEVREKRGLVYSISAGYRANTKVAGIFVFAGTAPERAQQTLDVTLEQLELLASGVSDEEVQRARTQLKASLVMQSERTAARALGLCSDWQKLRRARTLEEISSQIDSVTTDQVNFFLKNNPMGNFKSVIIGPEPLDCSKIR